MFDRIVCVLVTFYQRGHFVMLIKRNLNLFSVQSWTYPGAHFWEPATPIMSQCNGIFTDQSIFRYFSREIVQFQST